jgi:hypothetical protein
MPGLKSFQFLKASYLAIKNREHAAPRGSKPIAKVKAAKEIGHCGAPLRFFDYS